MRSFARRMRGVFDLPTAWRPWASPASLPSRTNFLCLDFETRDRADAVLLALRERGIFVRKPAREPLDRCVRVTIGRPDDIDRFLSELEAVLGA